MAQLDRTCSKKNFLLLRRYLLIRNHLQQTSNSISSSINSRLLLDATAVAHSHVDYLLFVSRHAADDLNKRGEIICVTMCDHARMICVQSIMATNAANARASQIEYWNQSPILII